MSFTTEFPPGLLAFWRINGLYLKNFLKCIPTNARLFCDVSQIEELQNTHRQEGLLWPLPVGHPSFSPRHAQGQNGARSFLLGAFPR